MCHRESTTRTCAVVIALAGSAQALAAPPFPASINLSTLNGTNGFVITGIDAGDRTGISVSSAGDVNGDGFDDLIIGATAADPNGQIDAGETYVVFGRATPFAASLDLSTLNGTNGFVINGIDAGDRSGTCVSAAGDVNGDGVGDIIIGAWGADPDGQSSAGESYVVFGRNTTIDGLFPPTLDLAALDGTNGFVVNGIATDDYSGICVSAAGDVNGDGIDDILVGAYNADPGAQSNAGQAYVVFGRNTAVDGMFPASLDLIDLDGANGFVLNGIDPGDRAGRSIARAGDVNGDGFDDLIIGAYRADPGGRVDAGESYVVFGGPAVGSSGSINLSSLNGTNGFVLNGVDAGDRGGMVATAGDVNGDGYDDLLIGADRGSPSGRTWAGESYVVFGGPTVGSMGSINLSSLNGTNGFVLNGVDAQDRSGFSARSAGDVNGDRFDDIIIGAREADPNNQGNAGESYLIFGGTTVGDTGSINLSSLNGNTGLVLYGITAGDESGLSVSSAGDVNGDGIDDLIIGAQHADPNGQSSAGESYVVFGRLVASVWNNATGGGFGAIANWQDGLVPTATDLTVFDNALTGLSDAAFTVVLPLAAPQTVRALRVRSDEVTLNLNGSAFTMGTPSSLALPGLTVGGRSDEPARLRLFNSQLLQTFVTAADAVIGPVPTDPLVDPITRLTLDGTGVGLSIANRFHIGDRAANAQCWILNGSDAAIGGDLRLGIHPGSDGQLRITQAGSTATLTGPAHRVVVGDDGNANLQITSGGNVETTSVLTSTTIAEGPASIATVTISGPGSRWITAQDDLIIAGAGDALVEISDGAELRTDTSNQLIVARDAGSSAEILISGAGSTWTELTQSIAVGGAGSAAVRLENGASLASIVGVNIRALGSITGDGTVNAPTTTNFGVVAPGSDIAPGTLTFDGAYRQTGAAPGSGAVSGALDLEVFGSTPGQHDAVIITGDAELAGRLRVSFAPGFVPAPESLGPIELLTADSNFEESRFDVALMPSLGADSFLSVAYNSGGTLRDGSRALASVSIQVNPLNGDIELDPQPGADSGTSGVPSAATLFDIDGDGDLDLLIALPDAINPTTAPGSVVILYNADDGNPGNGWEGFGQTLQITTGVGVNPSGIAVGRIDADTQPDIVVSNRGTPGNPANDTVSVVLVADPAVGSFATSATFSIPVGDEPADIIVADLDGDGILDFATADSGSDAITIGWNSGIGTGPTWMQVDTVPILLPDEDDVPVSIRPGDTNAGFAFLATANSGTNSIGRIQVNPNRTTIVHPNTPTDAGPIEIVVADLNLDGDDDIVALNRDGSSITIVLNTTGLAPTLTTAPPTDLPIPTSPLTPPSSIAAGDFDGDASGDIDLAILADGVIKVLRNDLFDDQLAFTPIADQPGGPSPLLVRAGDLNNDGRDDVVTIAESGGALMLAAGASLMPQPVQILLASPAPTPCAGDVNGDGSTNALDFNILAGNFGTTVPVGTLGDLNDDGTVNALDFNILAGDFGCGS